MTIRRDVEREVQRQVERDMLLGPTAPDDLRYAGVEMRARSLQAEVDEVQRAIDGAVCAVAAPLVRGLTRVVLLVERAVAFVTRHP